MFTEEEKTLLAVGLKETRKAIKQGAKKVIISRDAPEYIKTELRQAVKENLIEIDSMKELGKLCQIDVGATCAAIRNN